MKYEIFKNTVMHNSVTVLTFLILSALRRQGSRQKKKVGTFQRLTFVLHVLYMYYNTILHVTTTSIL